MLEMAVLPPLIFEAILVHGSNRVLYDAQPRPGAGSKRFTFVATTGNYGQCQIQIGGKGRVSSGQTTVNATVASGSTYTYDFSAAAEGGRSTDYGVTITINIPKPEPSASPSPTPKPSPTPTVNLILIDNSCNAGARAIAF